MHDAHINTRILMVPGHTARSQILSTGGWPSVQNSTCRTFPHGARCMNAHETWYVRVQRDTKVTTRISLEVSVILDARKPSLSVLSTVVGLPPIIMSAGHGVAL